MSFEPFSFYDFIWFVQPWLKEIFIIFKQQPFKVNILEIDWLYMEQCSILFLQIKIYEDS